MLTCLAFFLQIGDGCGKTSCYTKKSIKLPFKKDNTALRFFVSANQRGYVFCIQETWNATLWIAEGIQL